MPTYKTMPVSMTPISATTENRDATKPLSMDQYMGYQRSVINPEYNSARNRLTEQYNAQRPTFQQGRNNADVYAAQGQRQLGNLRAQQGLYRSGNYQTGTANLWNQAASQKGALDRDQNLYTQQYANRMGELAQSQAGALSRAALGYEDYNMQAQQLKQAIAAQQNQQRQAEINSYINLLLGQAQQTGKFTMPTKFDYGNRLVELLTAMRGGA